MKEIDLKECHKILLALGRKFHAICVENEIPYYMLGGTMLGAIRHKGFIPWDDDMDFGIPRPYFDKFVAVCSGCDMGYYKLYTRKDSFMVTNDVLKLADTRTVVEEVFKGKIKDDSIGVNIDIFPLDLNTGDKSKYSINWKIEKALKIKGYVILDESNRPLLKKIAARVMKSLLSVGMLDNYINKLMKQEAKRESLTFYANYYGAWGMKETISRKIFGTPTLYVFEDARFYGAEYSDAYLKSLYNNYMNLPPENKRHIHLEGCYWK